MENASQTNSEDSIKPEKPESNHSHENNSRKWNKLLLQCKYCPKKYKVLGSLKKHQEWCPQKKNQLTEEKGIVNEPKEKEEENKINKCKECGQTFKYPKILQKHEFMHKSKSPYWCKICMENFLSYEETVLHKMDKHPNKDKKRKCRICPDLNFNCEEEYLFHITELHKGQYDDYYMCSDCGRQFKTRSELTHHNNSKCGTIKQYKCKICEQDLMTAGSLHNHMLRHTGERCCMCGYCGKMFLTPGQLKVHERTHTQEKAFVCTVSKSRGPNGHEKSICGKGFCHRQSLITHSTLHTGIKPYQCDNCGQSFSCVGNLIKHRRTHSDTCGASPLTTHRVNNLSTKIKVKINTPNSSKLRMMKKEQELQEKLAKYKEKLNSSENESNQSNNSNDLLSSQNSDCSSYQGNEDKTLACGNLTTSEFDIKTKTVNDSTYVPNGNYLNNPISDEAPVENGCEMSYVKVRNDLKEYSNKLQIQEEKIVSSESRSELGYNLPAVDIHNTVAFEDVNCVNKNNQNKLFWLNTNDFESSDNNYYGDEHQNDNNYDSEDCAKIKPQRVTIIQRSSKKSVTKINTKKNKPKLSSNYNSEASNDVEPQKVTIIKKTSKKSLKKIPKKRKPQLTTTEVDKFVEQRGSNGATEVSCQYCKKVYTNLRWLFRHEKEHREKSEQIELNPKHFKCSCCKIEFETREECKAHQENAHADILTCKICKKIFSNVDSLRSHQNIFHKGRPKRIYIYICEKCGLQFRQKASLMYHEKSNCGTGPIYECHICGKGFNSMHTRRSHLRIHDPKKRYLCKFCGKSFRWKGQLKIHERSHTGEKPFKCLYCPKAFAYRESLITHSSLHTGIKPHLCQACGSRFSCIGNLIKHRVTHASTCGIWLSKNQ